MVLSKKFNLSLFMLAAGSAAFAQTLPKEYQALVKKADSLYQAKAYKESAFVYSAAFKSMGWKGLPNDRYNAACSWALANYPDSAFFQLNRIAEFGYADYRRVTADTDLDILHEDKRWQLLLDKLSANKEKAEAGLNKQLVKQLDTIYDEDQKYRLQMDEIGKKHGWQSKEMSALWKIANAKDSVNLIKVKAILDTYGWLGPEVIGQQGNTTLFLVIQHSDQQTQEKYLPMMREAVKNKKAPASSLALLEDRVALGQGKKQIYGSQIGRKGTSEFYVLPLEDPDNVDKRRAEVGLGPLQEYVNHWGITWNVEEYKKTANDRPTISFLKLDEANNLSWTVENESNKEIASIEQFRWNKWVTIGEMDLVLGTNGYLFHVTTLHQGENKFRVSLKSGAGETITSTSPFPAITYRLSGSHEILFSGKTLFEVVDNAGKVIKKGQTDKVAISDLPKGNYILNYDNSSASFKK